MDGVGDPAQSTGQVADNVDVQAGRVVLAGVELWVVIPAPAADQGASDDQLLIAGQFLGGRGERMHHPCQLKEWTHLQPPASAMSQRETALGESTVVKMLVNRDS